MKKSFLFLVMIFYLLVGCQSDEKTFPTTGNYRANIWFFERAMIGLMEKWEVPGGSLAVMKEGEIVLARGYGYANRETGELVQPDSLFRIASISKPFTAVAVLKLVEEGKLDLDTPAFQILDDLQPPEGKQVDPRIYQITIRNLLEHSGGWHRNASFDPMFMSRQIAQEMDIPGPPDCPTIIRYMLGQRLDFDPGTQYAYSNFGYCVLGRVIEKAAGMGYEDYVKAQILAPIGIEEMHIGGSLPVDRHPGEVHYYGTESEPAQSVFPEITDATTWPYGGFYLEAMDSHGGWVASAPDLVRFVAALDSTNPDAVLNADSLSEMLSRPDIPFWGDTQNYYAKGWFVRPSGEGVSMWHGGSLPGTEGMIYQTASGLIWVVLFNTRPDPPTDELIVDVITEMGKAAVMGKVLWGILILLGLLVSGATVIFIRRHKRKPPE